MLSLLELHFVLCTLDLDVLQRIMGFYFNYPQINEVGKSDRTRPQGLFPTPKALGTGMTRPLLRQECHTCTSRV